MEAQQRIRAGEPLEILVPRDGTLTFVLGLYSREPLALHIEQPLLEAGFRLPDGRCRNPVLPGDYSSAVPVDDYDRFLNETQDATRDLRRSVFRIRLLGSADGRESTLMFFFAILAALVWTACAVHRSPSRQMQQWVRLISCQIVCWILVSMLKYSLFDSTLLTRLLWYGYYLFLMGLPITMLSISAVIDRPETSRQIPGWLIPFLVLYPLLVILVFTNDFHQLVFRFDLSGSWEQDYTYAPGYFLIFGYCIVTFLASLVLLILKARRSPKRLGWAGPIAVAVTLVAYNICYFLGVPLVRDSNLSLMFCLFSALYVEAVLNAGLLPTNTHYRELFSSSPLNMQLLDGQGRVILAAADAQPLTDRERSQICAGVPTVTRNENTLLHARSIHGGTALWQEDLTSLNRQQEKLCTSIRQMESANALLHQEGEIRRRRIASEIQVQLFEQLEQELEDPTRELARLIRELPREEGRKQQIARIPLLLCHIKRRSNLFFLSRQGQQMSGNELAVYLDELSEFSAYAGIHALVRCGISGSLPVQTGTLCYDFYFTMLYWALRDSAAVLIGRLEQQKDALCFSILSSESTLSLEFPRAFEERLRQAGGQLTCRQVEESDSICLSFPKGGGAS